MTATQMEPLALHYVDAKRDLDDVTVLRHQGLEFEVVFVAGMAEGMFPDYRATSPNERAEETRNAFVAATRSKRLLYLSYPASRVMPWGDSKRQTRSRFLAGVRT